MKNKHPFIIKNLYLKSPINSIKKLEDLKLHFGHLEIHTNPNYYHQFGKKNYQYVVNLGDYIDSMLSKQHLTHFCSENMISPEMDKWFSRPKLNLHFNQESNIKMMYLAQKGNFAPIHYDSDHRSVLLTQIIGKKIIYLFPAGSGKLFFPMKNFSSINFNEFSKKEKNEFTKYHHGYQFILNPGDTVFIPFCMWHYTEYLTDGFSISIRLGRTPEAKVLSFLPANYHLQNIVPKIVNLPNKMQKNELLKAILTQYYTKQKNPFTRYQVMEDFLTKLYQQLCPELPQGNFTAPLFDHNLNWYKNQCSKNKTYNPPLTQNKDFQHVITTSQLKLLKRKLINCGVDQKSWIKLAKTINVNTDLAKIAQLDYLMIMDMLTSQHPVRYSP